MYQWIKGPPTKPGLYVWEWWNPGDLAVYIVTVNDNGELCAMNCSESWPDKKDLSEWSIKQHMEIEQIKSDNPHESGDIYTTDFNVETGKQANYDPVEFEKTKVALEDWLDSHLKR